jgi:hypothetical protein
MTAQEEMLALFPQLDRNVLVISSPQTPKYNCIAFAAGETHRWWWPDQLRVCYWPRVAPRSEAIPAFQAAFESIGYRLSSGTNLEDDVEKIAFFHMNGRPTHAARQLRNGLWTSKIGRSFDIVHDIEGMEGQEYGAIALIMERPL